MIDPQTIVANLTEVQGEIARAAQDSERPPADVALIAVSKTIPPEGIRPALAAGQRCFGENYVQEAKAKWPALREEYPQAELHLIGPLQSNKAREAVELFDVIHTLDRTSLAAALAKEIQRAAGTRPCWCRSIPARSRRRAGWHRARSMPSWPSAGTRTASRSRG